MSQLLLWLLDSDGPRGELQELADRQTSLRDSTFAACKAHASNSVKPEFSDKVSYVVWPSTILSNTHAA